MILNSPESAIFDLLGISFYHGWIVDPQDVDTSGAIGTKSYNTLMGELVALDTHDPLTDLNTTEEDEDSVDFVAATTATLGVPSPSITRDKSFDDPSDSVPEDKKGRKGDLEEEEEVLLRALKVYETSNDVNLVENKPLESSNEPVISKEVHSGAENDDSNAMKNYGDDLLTFETATVQYVSPSSQDKVSDKIEVLPTEKHECKDEIDKDSIDVLVQSEKAKQGSKESDLAPTISTPVHNSGDEKIQDQFVLINDVNSESSKCLTSSDVGSEPIYEGEEHIQEISTANYEDQEPMYEGEVVLAEQVETNESKGKDGITPRQGELIRNFLKNSASQLTIYGLRVSYTEYLLATDQGYINEPDLVWEKLNEVNGNTV